jgi:hypothetical protein
MPDLKSAAEDIAHRQPVWEALSDLFLDTDTSLSRQWRTQQLARSPYTLDQLERILVDEVYPVCKYNRMLAGEWIDFDQTWLQQAILRRLNSPLRAFRILNLGHVVMRTSSEWRATRQAIAETRQAIAAAAIRM